MEKAPRTSKEHTRNTIAPAPASPERHKNHHLQWTSLSLQLSYGEAPTSSSSQERHQVEDLSLSISHSFSLACIASRKAWIHPSEVWVTLCRLPIAQKKIWKCLQRKSLKNTDALYVRKQQGSLLLYGDGETLEENIAYAFSWRWWTSRCRVSRLLTGRAVHVQQKTVVDNSFLSLLQQRCPVFLVTYEFWRE